MNELAINNPMIKSWLLRLESLESTTKAYPANQPSYPKRELIYMIQSESYSNTIYLSLRLVKFRKDGEFARSGHLDWNFRDQWSHSFQNFKDACHENDWDLIHALLRQAKDCSYNRLNMSFPGAVTIIQKLLQTRRCFFKNDYNKSLSWGEPRKGTFAWKISPDHSAQKLTFRVGDDPIKVLHLDHMCYLDERNGQIGLIEGIDNPKLIEQLLNAPNIPHQEVKQVQAFLALKLPSIKEAIPIDIEEIVIETPLQISLKLQLESVKPKNPYRWQALPDYELLGCTITFKYDSYLFSGAKETKETIIVSQDKRKIVKVKRSFAGESEAVSILKNMFWSDPEVCGVKSTSHFVLPASKDNILQTAIYLIEHQVPDLKKMGWEVEIDPSFPIKSIHHGEDWYVESDEADDLLQNDWFDVKLGVMIDGERINLLPGLMAHVESLTKNGRWEEFETLPDHTLIPFITENGAVIKLPMERIRNITKHLLVEFSNKIGESLRVSKWNTAFLEEFSKGEASAKTRWIGSEALKNFAMNIRDNTGITDVEAPKELKCELRPYQKEGLNWLQFLRRNQMNGILADDMGLGKTVQTLAHIIIEKESGRMTSPCLVIAPTSLMPNWFNEASRLAPSLKVLVLHGNERRNLFSKIKDYDIVLTTYPLLMRDKEFLIDQPFHLLILDEAQMVKNSKTQAYQVVQQIKANHRLCLSGTPMENHLGELWSLFHLLLPGFLGDQRTFQKIYQRPIEKLKIGTRRDALAKRIKPFILRRTKQQVAIDLPDKTEIIQKVELKDKQRGLYEAIRLRAQEKVMKQIREKGLEKSQIIVLDALLKLRQVCCDPRLVKGQDLVKVEESAKLECLMDLLTQLLDENRKILIFSQFTSMLALIAETLNQKQIIFTTLTGETKDRDTPVRAFQSGTIPVMLISLKAGGVGLNLTAADTVIHYDPWWNPSVENQATDRAHRIGQKKVVFVYKLIVSGSLEEKILALQERKKGLVSALLDENADLGSKLSMEDLESIFQPLPPPV